MHLLVFAYILTKGTVQEAKLIYWFFCVLYFSKFPVTLGDIWGFIIALDVAAIFILNIFWTHIYSRKYKSFQTELWDQFSINKYLCLIIVRPKLGEKLKVGLSCDDADIDGVDIQQCSSPRGIIETSDECQHASTNDDKWLPRTNITNMFLKLVYLAMFLHWRLCYKFSCTFVR
jgi:hypothetical protein